MKNTTQFLVNTWFCSLVFGNLMFLANLLFLSLRSNDGGIAGSVTEFMTASIIISILGSIPAMIAFAAVILIPDRLNPNNDISIAISVAAACIILVILLLILMVKMIGFFESVFSTEFIIIYLIWAIPTSASIWYFSHADLFPKEK